MDLDQPLCGAGSADPHSRGVVVVARALGFVLGATVESVDDVIGGERRVWGENAHLEVAEFVGLELAVFQADQERIDCLDVILHFDEIFGEETAHGGEVAFGHGGPELLLEIDDFDGRGSRGSSLSRRECGEANCGGQKEKTHEPC